MSGAPARMTGGELQTVREWLGLTTEALAAVLGVRHDTVRRWEHGGREAIPYRVRDEVVDLERATAAVVARLVAELEATPERGRQVAVYRTDMAFLDDDEWRGVVARGMAADGFAPDALPAEELTTRWWRHVVARARQAVPGVVIGTRAELDALEA